jgi:CRISPR-associated protein Cmr1
MPLLQLELETVTPLFLGGAEPRGSPPELRAASVRGALRYWLRALLGGAMGDSDMNALKAAEDAVFGSTETGASPIIITLGHGNLQTVEFKKRPADRRSGRPKPEGADYLLWALSETGHRERGTWQPARKYVVPNSKFTLTMRPRLGAPDAEDIWWRAGAALWLLVQVGALGSRSRRGAGSLCVTKEPGIADLPPFETPATPQDLQKVLQSELHQIRQALVPTGRPHLPPQFDVLSPESCKIWVIAGTKTNPREPWKDWRQALDGIGGMMRDFRGYRPPDHDTVRDWMQGRRTPRTVERAAFGLPLPFRYSGGGPFDVIEGSEHDRRSSPLWLRVTKLSSGQHVGVATLFKSAFLSPGESLRLQRGHRTTAPPPDYSLVEKFIFEFPVCLEVKL